MRLHGFAGSDAAMLNEVFKVLSTFPDQGALKFTNGINSGKRAGHMKVGSEVCLCIAVNGPGIFEYERG
jgi:hypothetical protein